MPLSTICQSCWNDFLSSWVEPVLSSSQNVLLKDTTCADPGIFVRGGPGQSDKKSSDNTFFFFFQPSAYFTEVKRSISKEIYHFSRFQRPTFSNFPGGVILFPGGSNCLFPIETHITCDFPGGGGEGVQTPCPPLWIRTCTTQ